MTLPPFLAVIPVPVLIGIPVLGLGVIAWYEFIYKKTPAAGSLAPVLATAPAPAGAPSGAPMGATYAPPTASAAPHVTPGQVVLRAVPGTPHLSANDQLGLFAWGNAQRLPATFPNDSSGIYRGLALAALQTIQNNPTAATLTEQIAALSGSTNPGVLAVAAKLQTFPTAGLN